MGRLPAAAIKNPHSTRDRSTLGRQLRANCRVHILRLLRRRRQPGTDGPDRLVSHHRPGKHLDTQPPDHAAELTPDHLESLVRLALLQGLSDAEHRNQTAGLRRGELAAEQLVIFAQYQATLRMPDQHQTATRIQQLTGRNLTRQRTLPSLLRAILRTDCKRLAGQTFDHLLHEQARRKNCNFDVIRQNQMTQTFDQLSDAGAGTVHLPVTSYQGATHALPRRSKWAQILPKAPRT